MACTASGAEAAAREGSPEEYYTPDFYTDAAKYWEAIPSTVDGMLGGYGRLSSTDAACSKKFLLPLIKGADAVTGAKRVLDCGAGIGRVSKRLLLPLFSQVDLVEQNPTFLERAKSYIGESATRVGHYYAVGLQEFTPEAGAYDVIWCQWVLSHLTDDDLVSFLERCVGGLRSSGGLICAKENIATDEGDVFDDEDSSVTRCLASFQRIFSRAGLTVVKQEDQNSFPANMFQVTMFALAVKK